MERSGRTPTECPLNCPLGLLEEHITRMDGAVEQLKVDMGDVKPIVWNIRMLTGGIWALATSIVGFAIVALIWGGRIDGAVAEQKEQISDVRTDIKALTREIYQGHK